jgi:predicted DNA-binding transcriptional regulator AlpA
MYGHAVSKRLVAMSEAAELLGMSKQGFAKLLDRSPDFPDPLDVLSIGRIWARADVEAWARKHGRSVTPPAATGS